MEHYALRAATPRNFLHCSGDPGIETTGGGQSRNCFALRAARRHQLLQVRRLRRSAPPAARSLSLSISFSLPLGHSPTLSTSLPATLGSAVTPGQGRTGDWLPGGCSRANGQNPEKNLPKKAETRKNWKNAQKYPPVLEKHRRSAAKSKKLAQKRVKGKIRKNHHQKCQKTEKKRKNRKKRNRGKPREAEGSRGKPRETEDEAEGSRGKSRETEGNVKKHEKRKSGKKRKNV